MFYSTPLNCWSKKLEFILFWFCCGDVICSWSYWMALICTCLSQQCFFLLVGLEPDTIKKWAYALWPESRIIIWFGLEFFKSWLLRKIIYIVLPWSNILVRILYLCNPWLFHHRPGRSLYFIFALNIFFWIRVIFVICCWHLNVLLNLYIFDFWKSCCFSLSIFNKTSQLSPCRFSFRQLKRFLYTWIL